MQHSNPDFDPPVVKLWQKVLEDISPIIFPELIDNNGSSKTSNTLKCELSPEQIFARILAVGKGENQVEAWKSLNKSSIAEILAVAELDKLSRRTRTGATKSRTRASQTALSHIKLLQNNYALANLEGNERAESRNLTVSPVIIKQEESFNSNAPSNPSANISNLLKKASYPTQSIEIYDQDFALRIQTPIHLLPSPGSSNAHIKITLVPLPSLNSGLDISIKLVGIPGGPRGHRVSISSSELFAHQSLVSDTSFDTFISSQDLESINTLRLGYLEVAITTQVAHVPILLGPLPESFSDADEFLKSICPTSAGSVPSSENTTEVSYSSSAAKIASKPPTQKFSPKDITPTPIEAKKKTTVSIEPHVPWSLFSKSQINKPTLMKLKWLLHANGHGIIAVRTAVSNYIQGEYGHQIPLARTGFYSWPNLELETVHLEESERSYWRIRFFQNKNSCIEVTVIDKGGDRPSAIMIYGWSSESKIFFSSLLRYLTTALELYDDNLLLSSPQIVPEQQIEQLVEQIRNPNRHLLLVIRVAEHQTSAEKILVPRSWWNNLVGLAHIRVVSAEVGAKINQLLGDSDPLTPGDIILFSPGAGGDDPGNTEALLPAEEVINSPEIQVGGLLIEQALSDAIAHYRNPHYLADRKLIDDKVYTELAKHKLIVHIAEKSSSLSSLVGGLNKFPPSNSSTDASNKNSDLILASLSLSRWASRELYLNLGQDSMLSQDPKP